MDSSKKLNVYRFTNTKKGVEQVRFRDCHKGDVIYFEEPDEGGLWYVADSGHFMWQVLRNPVPVHDSVSLQCRTYKGTGKEFKPSAK